MEKFYTPKDVERKFGIERNTLTHWRANLIGPDCFRWKGKILYHAKDIEQWFKIENAKTETKPKKKPEAEPAEKVEPDPNPIQDPKSESEKELLTPMEVSERFDIGHKTLANWRSERRGPAYHKLGKRIRYPMDKVEEWFSTNEVKRYQSRRR